MPVPAMYQILHSLGGLELILTKNVLYKNRLVNDCQLELGLLLPASGI